jgi:hypothetical protein
MKTQRGQLIAHDSAHGLQILSKDACIPNAPSTSRRSPTTSAARRPAQLRFASSTTSAARRPAQLRLTSPTTSEARRPARLRLVSLTTSAARRPTRLWLASSTTSAATCPTRPQHPAAPTYLSACTAGDVPWLHWLLRQPPSRPRRTATRRPCMHSSANSCVARQKHVCTHANKKLPSNSDIHE